MDVIIISTLAILFLFYLVNMANCIVRNEIPRTCKTNTGKYIIKDVSATSTTYHFNVYRIHRYTPATKLVYVGMYRTIEEALEAIEKDKEAAWIEKAKKGVTIYKTR